MYRLLAKIDENMFNISADLNEYAIDKHIIPKTVNTRGNSKDENTLSQVKRNLY